MKAARLQAMEARPLAAARIEKDTGSWYNLLALKSCRSEVSVMGVPKGTLSKRRNAFGNGKDDQGNMNDPYRWLEIIALLICIALSAFFSASDTAYLAANRVRLKARDAKGRKGAGLALRLQEDYDRLLTTILVGNNLVNIAATAIATVLFTHLMGSIGPTVATAVMTLLILLFGEISPKTLAKKKPEKTAIKFAAPLSFLNTVLYPVDRLFALFRSSLEKMPDDDEEESLIEEELMTMVDEAQNEGDMDAREGELIRSAIEFNDRDAISIVTPRVDITAIEETATMEETAKVFRENGYSRIPVIREDLDHVVGILNEKDFYAQMYEGCTDIRRIMKPPVWAPSSLKISKLLKLFQSSKTHMVILVDEFGGTEGVVTMEDVLEELVGEIYDEHDDITEEMIPLEDGSYMVDGSMQLSDLMEELCMEDRYDADTVGGWAAEMLERIPNVGDAFDEQSVHAVVTAMEKRRVTKVRIQKIAADDADAKGAEKE